MLIIARDLASKLATPAFLVDDLGNVVFYNEAAEGVLGRPFVESQGMPAKEWLSVFRPVDDAGGAIPLPELPLGSVLEKGRPAHGGLWIRGEADGVDRRVEVTALPLFSSADEFVGGIAVFWETSGER